MSATLFPYGVEKVYSGWTTLNFGWALLGPTWIPSPYIEAMMSDIAGYELTDASYSRQAMTLPTVSPVVYPDLGIMYDCADPAFGVIVGGEVAASLVLYRDSGADASSEIVAALPCAYVADGTIPATFVLSATGAVSAAMNCPSGFY